jgi:hypothetical protein
MYTRYDTPKAFELVSTWDQSAGPPIEADCTKSGAFCNVSSRILPDLVVSMYLNSNMTPPGKWVGLVRQAALFLDRLHTCSDQDRRDCPRHQETSLRDDRPAGSHGAASLSAAAAQIGGNVVITIDGSDAITINSILRSHMSSANFDFAAM